MGLQLYWRDKEDNIYNLGELSKENYIYTFAVFKEGFKKATLKGCPTVDEFTPFEKGYKSLKLFPFFRERIPSESNPKIREILEHYEMQEYDDMQLLKKTEAKMLGDNFYIKED